MPMRMRAKTNYASAHACDYTTPTPHLGIILKIFHFASSTLNEAIKETIQI
jgi:hypothetical protein